MTHMIFGGVIEIRCRVDFAPLVAQIGFNFDYRCDVLGEEVMRADGGKGKAISS